MDIVVFLICGRCEISNIFTVIYYCRYAIITIIDLQIAKIHLIQIQFNDFKRRNLNKVSEGFLYLRLSVLSV